MRKNFRDGDRFFIGTSLITLLLFTLLLLVGSGTGESMDGGAIGSLVLVVLSSNSAFFSWLQKEENENTSEQKYLELLFSMNTRFYSILTFS